MCSASATRHLVRDQGHEELQRLNRCVTPSDEMSLSCLEYFQLNFAPTTIIALRHSGSLNPTEIVGTTKWHFLFHAAALFDRLLRRRRVLPK